MENQDKKCKFCLLGQEGECKCKKIILKVIFALLIFIGIWLIAYCSIKTYTNYSNPKTIIISGKGEVSAVPDISTINFTMRSSRTDKDTKSLQDEISKSADSVFTKLKELGISEKDIKTVNYYVNPKYGYQDCYRASSIKPCDSNVVVGYEASESVQIKVRNTDNVAKVLTILAESNITEVSGPNFEIDDTEKLKIEARDMAIADAKVKAKILAKSLDVKIKKIVAFYDEENNMPSPMMYKAMSLESGMGGDATRDAVLAPGDQKITSNVSITFEIEN